MPDENPSTPPSQESAWLEQYYTASKTHEPAGDLSETGYSVTSHIAATDRYAIGAEVGSGGMKSVRRAHDQNASRDVAMAVLREGRSEPRFIRRFVREARLTAALEHPNIVPVHEIGVAEDGRPYFTMKLLGGESLHSVLQKLDAGDADYRRRYTLARLLQIFLGAGNAVAFAHSRGVIHLDLKPANIQVGGFGEVLVLDWGLAKIMERDGVLVLPEELRVVHTEGVVRGTPGFMAPEQTRGEYSKFDERTDVSALGAVLQTLLTGKLPAPTSSQGRARLQSNPPDGSPEGSLSHGEGESRMKELVGNRRIPVALQAVVLKATATDPADRYQSVRDLLQDVQAFLAGYATSAQQASTLTLLWLLLKRQKVAATLIAGSFVVILTIGVVAFVRVARSERVALNALAQIEQEQAANRKLSLLAAPRVFQRAGELLRSYDFDGAMEQLNFAVALDGTLASAWSLKGWLHLGREEFEESLIAFEQAARRRIDRAGKVPERVRNVEDLVVRYRALPKPLTREQRIAFVGDMHRLGRPVAEWSHAALAQFFALQNRRDMDFALIADELQALNPDSKTLEFVPVVAPDGLAVTVRGEKVTQLLPLLGLPLKTLDVSGVPTADLNPLRAVPTLTELRIVKWPRNTYQRVWPLTQLTRVVVGSNEVVVLQNDLRVRMSKPPQVVAE